MSNDELLVPFYHSPNRDTLWKVILSFEDEYNAMEIDHELHRGRYRKWIISEMMLDFPGSSTWETAVIRKCWSMLRYLLEFKVSCDCFLPLVQWAVDTNDTAMFDFLTDSQHCIYNSNGRRNVIHKCIGHVILDQACSNAHTDIVTKITDMFGYEIVQQLIQNVEVVISDILKSNHETYALTMLEFFTKFDVNRILLYIMYHCSPKMVRILMNHAVRCGSELFEITVRDIVAMESQPDVFFEGTDCSVGSYLMHVVGIVTPHLCKKFQITAAVLDAAFKKGNPQVFEYFVTTYCPDYNPELSVFQQACRLGAYKTIRCLPEEYMIYDISPAISSERKKLCGCQVVEDQGENVRLVHWMFSRIPGCKLTKQHLDAAVDTGNCDLILCVFSLGKFDVLDTILCEKLIVKNCKKAMEQLCWYNDRFFGRSNLMLACQLCITSYLSIFISEKEKGDVWYEPEPEDYDVCLGKVYTAMQDTRQKQKAFSLLSRIFFK